MAHVHVLCDGDVVLGLLEELRHRHIVRLGQVLSDGNVVFHLLQLLSNGSGRLHELSYSHIISGLVEEFSHCRVQKLCHGNIIGHGQLSDYVLHLINRLS